ncbi:hypothetical protein OH76DRAFT_323971 [Lentinus brumalis]|uniref:Uncharacterized protein n=1 Tax=Lentinus brumalis TaxID=2498619 RepID=A0A371DFN5_9APHY|nr:hypothetical protein OH76DRAFT_323971 [Polyporus brumalis]
MGSAVSERQTRQRPLALVSILLHLVLRMTSNYRPQYWAYCNKDIAESLCHIRSLRTELAGNSARRPGCHVTRTGLPC